MLDGQRVSSRCRCEKLLGAILGLALAAAPPASGELAQRLVFRPLARGLHGQAVSALAIESASGRLAIGDSRGVLLGGAGGNFRRVMRRGPVRDLAFVSPASDAQQSPVLLAATARGLYRIDAGSRVVSLATRPGQAANDVRRIAVAAGVAAVATGAGVFLSRDARRWERLSSTLPTGTASSVALRQREGDLECWSVIDGALWRTRLEASGGQAATTSMRETIPFAASGAPVDIVFGLPDADVTVVYPATLALRSGAAGSWRILRPPLPPGAAAQRLVSGLGRLWLATDRGLLVATALEGPWSRSPAPAGSSPVRALAAGRAALIVAAEGRVLVADLDAPALARRVSPASREFPREPAIDRVHRAALAYLELRPARIAALRRGVSRRGWLPELALRLSQDRDSASRTDHDQAFLSGAVRSLVDRDNEKSDEVEVSLTFSWDLGDLAYHPEEIDISREAREIIELRDDVLDEITQLYFERRRVLAELAEIGGDPTEHSLTLRLRAAELAAGIDAWTGGWFSTALAP